MWLKIRGRRIPLLCAAAPFLMAWSLYFAPLCLAQPALPFEQAPCIDDELRTLAAEADRALEEGHWGRAEQAARELVAAVEGRCGPTSPSMAQALDLLVRCLRTSPTAGDSTSLEFAQRAVDLKRQLYGNRDPRLALSLTYQAALLTALGSDGAAQPLFETALRMSEETLGPSHPQVALILEEWALLFDASGEYERAIASCGRALKILENASPVDSVLTSAVLNLLAVDRYKTSDYKDALFAIDRAIAIRRALYGNDHPRVQGIVNNRAAILYDMGDLEGARSAYTEILEGLRHTLEDPEDPRIGVALLNAGMTTLPNDPVACRSFLKQAREIFVKRLGPNHELAVKCILDLGMSFYLANDLETARSTFEDALRRQESVAPRSRLAASLLSWNAAVDYELGNLNVSRRACERALAIYTESLGADNPETAEAEVLLGAILAQVGESQEAVSHSLQAERIATDHLRLMSRGFAEREALLYALERPHGLDLPLTILAKAGDAETTSRVWDMVMRSRAVVYDEMAARRRSTTLARDPEVARLYMELRRTSSRLAQLIVAGPGSDPEAHARDLDAARKARETTEKALALRCVPLAEEQVRERAGLSEVAQSLPKGWALVSYVVYKEFSPRLAPGVQRYGLRAELKTPHLQVFVLGARGTIASVSLGPVAAVEALVAAWSREAAGASGENPSSSAALSAYRQAGSALRAKVWDPVVPLLENAARILVVPDGILHRLSFVTLPVGANKYLVDDGYRFHYLGAERDLIEADAGREVPPRGKGLLALGEIDYSAYPNVAASQTPQSSGDASQTLALGGTGKRSVSKPCQGLEGVLFPPLPGTAREIDQLAAHWKRTSDPYALAILRGAAATEAAFKSQCSGYRFLHIATHGFVLGPDCEGAPESTRGIHPKPLAHPPPPSTPTNSLSLSGLAFAGANHRQEVSPGQEDGILTAEEVAALDLQGLEWAVLSGCDTGIGEIQTGEGVLGLRRAFQIAGARTLIMSLWPVSDRATVDWMQALYTARLANGESTIDAVHDATAHVLDARRQHGESTHPFYWGGFVATGDWR